MFYSKFSSYKSIDMFTLMYSLPLLYRIKVNIPMLKLMNVGNSKTVSKRSSPQMMVVAKNTSTNSRCPAGGNICDRRDKCALKVCYCLLSSLQRHYPFLREIHVGFCRVICQKMGTVHIIFEGDISLEMIKQMEKRPKENDG